MRCVNSACLVTFAGLDRLNADAKRLIMERARVVRYMGWRFHLYDVGNGLRLLLSGKRDSVVRLCHAALPTSLGSGLFELSATVCCGHGYVDVRTSRPEHALCALPITPQQHIKALRVMVRFFSSSV